MAGSRDRFEQLFAQHSGAVQRFALRRVERSAVEDIVSDTFLVAWRRLEEVPPAAERAWLLTTARWVVANHLRSQKRQGRVIERMADRVGPAVTK